MGALWEIISSIDNPLYSLASFLYNIVKDNLLKPKNHIDNSFQLVEKELNGLCLNNNYSLISLDIIPLFINIRLDLTIKSISGRWYFITRCRCISKDEFLKALRLVLESFIFDNIYNQKFGIPMSSPLSPIIADLVMEDLECRMLERFRTEVPFYFSTFYFMWTTLRLLFLIT